MKARKSRQICTNKLDCLRTGDRCRSAASRTAGSSWQSELPRGPHPRPATMFGQSDQQGSRRAKPYWSSRSDRLNDRAAISGDLRWPPLAYSARGGSDEKRSLLRKGHSRGGQLGTGTFSLVSHDAQQCTISQERPAEAAETFTDAPTFMKEVGPSPGRRRRAH